MLTLKQCNYLISIVEEGSFIAAAEKLFIAQSALSRQIKILEEEINFEIFDRSEKKIKLTPAGQVLYKELKNHLQNLKSSIALAQEISLGKGRTLRIAHSSSIILDPQKLSLLEILCQTYHVEIEITLLSSEQQIESILDGSIDLGLIRPPIYHSLDHINHDILYKNELLVAVPITDSFFSDRSNIHISELAEQSFVSIPHSERGGLSYLASNLCISNGFFPKKAKIRSRKISQLNLVASGLGICIVPEEFHTILPPNVKLLPILDSHRFSEVMLIWKKEQDDLIQNCANMFRNFFGLNS